MSTKIILVALMLCVLGFEVSGVLCMDEEECSRDCGKGNCVMYKNTSMCVCPGGYLMPYCPMRCTNSTCKNGGTCIDNMNGEIPKCANCTDGYVGQFCEIMKNITVNCTSTTCDEDGSDICTMAPGGKTTCYCKRMFGGKKCDVKLCQVKYCMNGACNTTYNLTMDDCMCMKGWKGNHCQMMDPCYNITCENNGTCYNDSGVFRCMCAPGWEGKNCKAMLTTMPTTMMTTTEPEVCRSSNCSALSSNQQCDLDCSLRVCKYDNFECTGGQNPWRGCREKTCDWSKFGNDICNQECNNEECLFDGFNCNAESPCQMDNYCSSAFDNGMCDDSCNVSSCAYDGLDCEMNKGKWLPGNSILGSLTIKYVSNLNSSELAYQLSQQLRVILYSTKVKSSRGPASMMMNSNVKEAVYEVDNRYNCGINGTCWTDIDNVANSLAAFTLINNQRKQLNATIKKITATRECPAGKFGEDCQRQCSMRCKYDKCDKMTGECTMGCIAGYSGYNCSEECTKGRYGDDCSYQCTKCKYGNCERINGNCQSGCILGYTTVTCNTKCTAGTYGDRCMGKCSDNCKNNLPCNFITGHCLCKAGYRGERCKDQCLMGTYGENCGEVCSKHCKMDKCDKATGYCTEGCEAGFKDMKCMTECYKGTYGENCKQNCSEMCFKETCDKRTGHCRDCKSGYEGDMCEINPAERKTDEEDESGESDNAGIIAGIVVLVILIIIVLVIFFFLWRRSQAGVYDMEENKQPQAERSIPLDQMEIENDLIVDHGVSTSALIDLDEVKETQIANTTNQEPETMGDIAEKNAVGTDEDKPLLDSDRHDPDGKESSVDRESRDVRTSSVYQPPTDGEGGPGGVYVGPGKDATLSEALNEGDGSSESPNESNSNQQEAEKTDDQLQSQSHEKEEDSSLVPKEDSAEPKQSDTTPGSKSSDSEKEVNEVQSTPETKTVDETEHQLQSHDNT